MGGQLDCLGLLLMLGRRWRLFYDNFFEKDFSSSGITTACSSVICRRFYTSVAQVALTCCHVCAGAIWLMWIASCWRVQFSCKASNFGLIFYWTAWACAPGAIPLLVYLLLQLLLVWFVDLSCRGRWWARAWTRTRRKLDHAVWHDFWLRWNTDDPRCRHLFQDSDSMLRLGDILLLNGLCLLILLSTRQNKAL